MRGNHWDEYRKHPGTRQLRNRGEGVALRRWLAGDTVFPQQVEYLSGGIAGVVNELRRPSEQSSGFDILLPVVEEENPVAGITSAPFYLAICLLIGFQNAHEMAAEAIPRTKHRWKLWFHGCLGEKTRPLRIVRIREYGGFHTRTVQGVKDATDTRVFSDQRGIADPPGIIGRIRTIRGLSKQRKVPLTIDRASAPPRECSQPRFKGIDSHRREGQADTFGRLNPRPGRLNQNTTEIKDYEAKAMRHATHQTQTRQDNLTLGENI